MANICTNRIEIKTEITNDADKNRFIEVAKKLILKTNTGDGVLSLPDRQHNGGQWEKEYALFDVDIVEDILSTAGEGYLEIAVESRWSPPEKELQKLSEMYPFLLIDCTFCEPGLCFAGHFHYAQGRLIQEYYVESQEVAYYEIYSELLGELHFDDCIWRESIRIKSKAFKKLFDYIANVSNNQNSELEWFILSKINEYTFYNDYTFKHKDKTFASKLLTLLSSICGVENKNPNYLLHRIKKQQYTLNWNKNTIQHINGGLL